MLPPVLIVNININTLVNDSPIKMCYVSSVYNLLNILVDMCMVLLHGWISPDLYRASACDIKKIFSFNVTFAQKIIYILLHMSKL